MLKNTGVFPAPSVATTGQSLISHAGLNVLTSFVDALDFRELCEERLGQFVPSGATYRPGTILGPLALMLAAGGVHVSDLDILRTSPGVFGKVASNATISRFCERTVANPDLFVYGFATMTRQLRSRVWAAAGDRNPALRATALEPLILDLDATLITSHSDKEQAVGTYKGGYGFAPFVASIDYETGRGTGEILAVALRPGNAGANSADDHIKIFTAAIAQLPDVIGLTDYPQGTNLYLRAEPLHPGAQATLLDQDGHRITAFMTNAPRWHGPTLDARHRGRGRCENRIKTLKNTGLGKLPFFDFNANQAWANLAALAMNLVSWLQLAALPAGHAAKGWDVKRWRYRLFATAGKLIARARRTRLLIPEHAPEASTITTILDALSELKQRRRKFPLLA